MLRVSHLPAKAALVRDVIRLWRYTRMVVLVAITAALYAAILIPFKVAIPLIPGFTELRPANVIPIICSLLFGPAAAWGSAFGNLVGDSLGGTLGLGSIFGFIGNFLYGYIPYKLWGRLGLLSPKRDPDFRTRTGRTTTEYLTISLVASLACGLVIGWGVDLLGMVPFAALANIIVLNNFIVASVLGPVLLAVIYPRMKRWGLLYTDIMDRQDLARLRLSALGVPFLVVGVFSGILVGNLIAVGIYESPLLAAAFGRGPAGEVGISLGLLPSIFLILVASFLL